MSINVNINGSIVTHKVEENLSFSTNDRAENIVEGTQKTSRLYELLRSILKDSISDMGRTIFKDWHGKEVNLVNTIKSCLRDDKLTLQGIEEERNRAGMVLDITKKVNLGLLYIFIFEYRLALASTACQLNCRI